MQGAESSEQCKRTNSFRRLRKKTNTSGSRNHYRRISQVEQTVRINQPRPSTRELEEGAGRMSASRQKQSFPRGPPLTRNGSWGRSRTVGFRSSSCRKAAQKLKQRRVDLGRPLLLKPVAGISISLCVPKT
jgi:hypothetical protein